MALPNKSAADAADRCIAHCVTRDEVAAAFDRAVAEARCIVGEDDAIDLIADLGAGEPPGNGPFTFEEAVVAWNAAAEWAKDTYNPEDIENSHTIRSDSCGDLIVNLAVGFLRDPGCDTDDVIAEQWADLEPDCFQGFQVWNGHVNDIGDYCPWSGRQATPDSREALMSGLEPDDDSCPQGCRASTLEDPPKGSRPYKAAIVATVKGWVS
jgi:hypothetical protein